MAQTESEKLSSPGKYSGYTTQQYKGFQYNSLYVTMRDSTKIAIDVFLPKKLEEGRTQALNKVRTLYEKWL